ncbi:HEPN domain-containing protein [Streptomyces gibsoniae]|uniref:HEPN domain-containing protein n=1 Tax=Streptomyces gibsoniae TaxID=3075529 RepID=A0ABU2U6S2_9ACTN|nr:HEPN domain-containing protein [Streptomyces sp. DSM 41699]MDT0468736.1 HEPN domain-containing protein [Streptomyces sp. DSM 41699]
MGDNEAVQSALHEWFKDLKERPPKAYWSVEELSQRDSWVAVRKAVGSLATPQRRPDLYGKDGTALNDSLLILDTGLGQVAEAAASGLSIPMSDLSQDLTAFCNAEIPTVQTWILLDIDLPFGIDIRMGSDRLRTVTSKELSQLEALPSMRAFVRPSIPNADAFHGATFLLRPELHGLITIGDSVFAWPDQRPERKHVAPLLTLQLWQPSESMRAEAYLRVADGHSCDLLHGSLYDEPVFNNEGEEVGERHPTWGYSVPSSQTQAFAMFCTKVSDMVSRVLARTRVNKNGKPESTASSRALKSAAAHLVRASQRTRQGTYVDEAETDDVLLDYVIAMESLMTAGERGDSTRKTSQRAASMWMRDEDRLATSKIIRRAYNRRSNYAHGTDQEDITTDELLDVRCTAFEVLLRWLVLTDGLGEAVHEHLDKSLLSDQERRTMRNLLRDFFISSPPAELPPDMT